MIALLLTAAFAAEPPLVQLLYPPGFTAWGGEFGDAGDLDGNGFSDVAVLAIGAAEIYAVSASGLDAAPAKRLEGWDGDLQLAVGGLRGVGDIDQDGFDDLAAVVDSGDRVTLAVFRGGCNGVSHEPWARIELGTKEHSQRLAYGATGPAGDLDGDGYPDFVAVYRPLDEGAPIRVFRGGPFAEDVEEMQSLVFPGADQTAGPSVLVVPDLTGDAYPDLVVVAESSPPLLVVFPGRAGGQFGEGTIEVSEEGDGGYQAPVDLGDLDGDGIHELMAARPRAGMLRVFHGGRGGPDEARASDLDVGLDTLCIRGVTADADDDGDLDVFALYWWKYENDYSFGLATFTQQGGSFEASPSDDWRNVTEGYPLTLNCSLLAGPDADGDGWVNILAATPEGMVSADPSDVEGTARLIVPYPAHGESFGSDVVFPGDIDGDGLGDLVVGHPDAANRSGGIDIFLREAAEGFDPEPASYRGSGSRDFLGSHVAALGDLDGDGGADFSTWGEPDTGAAYGMPAAILLAAGRGPPTLAVELLTEQVYKMGAAGDLDGDGFGDVVAGLCNCVEVDGDGDGCVRVYYGGAGGPTEASLVEFLPDPLPAPLSICATTGPGGDVDGDGLADFVVGSDDAEDGAGRLFYYPGAADRQFPDLPIEVRGEAGEGLGSDVGVLGDVDGDGYADVWASGGYEIRGYPGASHGMVGEPNWTFAAEHGVGVTLVPAGDFDADGKGDFVLRQKTDDGITAALVPGGSGGPDLAAAIPLFDTEGTVPYASSLAVGDILADGSAEFAVGQAGGGSGHVWLFSDRFVPAEEPCPDTGTDTGGDTAPDSGDSAVDDSAGDSGASDTGDSAPPSGNGANEQDCGCSASAGAPWLLSLVATAMAFRRHRSV